MTLLCYGEVLLFFTLRLSDLISTLTYVLMDNFCPCFILLFASILSNRDQTNILNFRGFKKYCVSLPCVGLRILDKLSRLIILYP